MMILVDMLPVKTGEDFHALEVHNLERYGRRSFSCAGPTLWNALPEDIRMTVNINAFKAQLKTHYFKVAFN